MAPGGGAGGLPHVLAGNEDELFLPIRRHRLNDVKMKPNLQLTINTFAPILRLLPLLRSLASHFHCLPVKVVRKLLAVLASVADVLPRLDQVTDGEVSQLQIAVRR